MTNWKKWARCALVRAVKTVSFNDGTIATYRDMLRSVDLIVVVLVVSAAAPLDVPA